VRERSAKPSSKAFASEHEHRIGTYNGTFRSEAVMATATWTRPWRLLPIIAATFAPLLPGTECASPSLRASELVARRWIPPTEPVPYLPPRRSPVVHTSIVRGPDQQQHHPEHHRQLSATAEVGSQVELINSIASGSTIQFLRDIPLGNVSFFVAGEDTGIVLSGVRDLVLNGDGLQVSGLDRRRCFYINGSNTEVALINLRITDCVADNHTAAPQDGGFDFSGRGAGLFVSSEATVTMANVTITRCRALVFGGGMFIVNGVTLTMSACNITSNVQVQGALYVWLHCTLRMHACTISNNYATYGAGMLITTHIDLTMGDSLVTNNTAPGGGGGGFYIYLSIVRLNRSVISGCSSLFGAGINLGSGANCYLDGTSVANNVATGPGGGVALDNGALLTAVNSIIGSNSAMWGGGLVLDASGAARLNNSLIKGNTALKGGGFYISGSSSALSMSGGGLLENAARGDSGGGGAYVASGAVLLHRSEISGNAAFGPSFELKSGSCTTGGGCFYSSNYPADYVLNDACRFVAGADGTLDVVAFNTEVAFDYVEIHGVRYDGIFGPQSVGIRAGDNITFYSDEFDVSSGFQICYASESSGGGFFITGGSVEINECLLQANTAVRHGGALFVDGGEVEVDSSTISNNTAARGDGLFLTSGSFNSVGLTLQGDFDGASIGSAACHSPCLPGAVGVCRQDLGMPRRCFVDCTCAACPPGKASSNTGATSSRSCASCGTGQFSASGAAACSSCPAGTYATDNPSDDSGGLIRQVPSGATICNPCPPGTFSETPSTIVCLRCPVGYSSLRGSTECSLAAEDYYIDVPASSPTSPVVTSECPENARCPGGDVMPIPMDGFWVAQSDVAFAADIKECPSRSCTQPNTDNTTCWSLPQYSDTSSCFMSMTQCRPGSMGPLCGACARGFKYSASNLVCTECVSTPLQVALLTAALFFGAMVLAFLYFIDRLQVHDSIKRLWSRIVEVLLYIPMGADRVILANYQIIQGISWTVGIKFPYPESHFSATLSILNLDFFSFSCFLGAQDYLDEALFWAIAPLLLIVMNCIVYIVRNRLLRSEERSDSQQHKNLVNCHVSIFLTFTFIILPATSRKLLGVYDCVALTDHNYLRVDTSIDCDTKYYIARRNAISVLLFGYLSVPLVWMRFLYRKKEWLTPGPSEHYESAKLRRDEHTGVYPLKFLYQPYKMEYFGFEVIELYRRVFFIGVLPLVTNDNARKAALGMCSALASLILFRESEPFEIDATNTLAALCQLTVLLNFGAALVIATELSNGLEPSVLGTILVAANCVVLGLFVAMSFRRFWQRKRENAHFRSMLSTHDFAMIQSIMDGRDPGSDDGGSSASLSIEMSSVSSLASGSSLMSGQEVAVEREISQHLLSQHLLSSGDVKLIRRVGAGSFGEVYEGVVLGERVAIKTMLNVTMGSAQLFRAEILLNANLRHLNVVGFVGACWGRDLVALVLEWCPRGSLDGFLEDRARSLTWNEPMLRLATDIARGMVYLHDREYYDEVSMTRKKCIIHRDLKPDNVMVTHFISAKIGDFGSSRAKDTATMTAVGTPLYAAPELMRGERFDESVDVYSFGMTLLDFAVEEELALFVGERWRAAFGAPGAPVPNPKTIAFNAVLRPIWEDGWRPFSERDPTDAVSYAPASVCSLFVRCCAHNPKSRPTFESILNDLKGPCAVEIDSGTFFRSDAGRLRLSALQATRRASEAALGPNAAGNVILGINPMIRRSLPADVEKQGL